MASPEKFLQKAGEALGADKYAEALAILDEAIEQFPQHADALVLRGIALAELKRDDEATASFRRAIALAPTRFKAYYNFATHLFQTGKMAEAQQMCEKALELNPTHADARDLMAHLRDEEPAPRPQLTGRPYQDVEFKISSYRLGEPVRPDHAIPWIRTLGRMWPAIGWVISATSAASMVLLVASAANYMSNPSLAKTGNFVQRLYTGGEYTVAIVVALVLFVLTCVWSVLDLLDRSSREYVWVLLLCLTAFPLCIVVGFQWVTLPLYLLFGRKT